MRNRKKPYQIENLFNQFDQIDDDDGKYLMRTKSMKRDRPKTLKEKKLERQASSLKARKTFTERYNEMKDSDEVNPMNLAYLLR